MRIRNGGNDRAQRRIAHEARQLFIQCREFEPYLNVPGRTDQPFGERFVVALAVRESLAPGQRISHERARLAFPAAGEQTPQARSDCRESAHCSSRSPASCAFASTR
jgi:hypothetical protein